MASDRNAQAGLGLVLPRIAAFRRFWADEQASWWKKAFLLLLVFYVLFPADFVPDIVPFWGWLDDLGAVGIGWLLLSWVLKPYGMPEVKREKLEQKKRSNVEGQL